VGETYRAWSLVCASEMTQGDASPCACGAVVQVHEALLANGATLALVYRIAVGDACSLALAKLLRAQYLAAPTGRHEPRAHAGIKPRAALGPVHSSET
jgi:hypothetical protein